MTTQLLWMALSLLTLLCTVSHCVSSKDSQPDPSNPQQGITFSHVYKIDVPGRSSCTLEHLPSQDETGLQKDTTKNGENDIIFKHNIRLQTPKCDCEDSESFKNLLYRVNGLEEEVNYLKTQCTQGCCGGGGAAGVDTSCSGHGTYQHETCSCLCNLGWEGPDCSVSSCPDECNNNGLCVEGKCVCYYGYTGEDCSQLTCANNCNDKGQCVDGKCICFPHFTGESCNTPKCPNDCADNGHCVNGQCICDEGFHGEDCSLVTGPQGLRLIQKTDVSLLVEWDSVRGAEYYTLTYHPKYDEVVMKQVRVSNTENSYLIKGLTPGVTYMVQIYDVIKKTRSEANVIEATTDVSAIDDIRVLGQTEVSIQVDWKNPQAEVDYFSLKHTDPLGQEEELEVQMSQEARTKHTIVGLYPGTEYQISVQAIKGNTEGKSSLATGVTEIDAPTNIVTTEVTEDTATVSWDQVQAKIEGYMLSYTSAGGSSPDIPVGRDSTSYRLVGLRPGVLHTIYIWAFRGDQVSSRSSTEAETELDAPTNLLVKEETDSSFRLSWDHTQADIDSYLLTYSSFEGLSEEILVGSDSSYVLTNLKPGVIYTIYVWAAKGSKASRKISTQAETELDAPANLVVRDETESSFTISWNPVQAEVDGYILTYTHPDGSSEEIHLGPNSTSYVLTGLKPALLYTVYIRAVKGNKTSRRISTQAETDIDSPKNLKASNVQADSASLSWIPPLAKIDGYILTYRDEEGKLEIVERKLAANQKSFTASSLEMGKRYIVTIVAYRGYKRSKMVETIFKTVGMQHSFPVDCVQILKNGNSNSGIYTVYINNNRSKPVEAFCDMHTDGGGWLVLQRRNTGKLDFMKRWKQYIAGFGNLTEEFWLGLEKIYELTNTPTQYELRFDLGLGSERAYAVYDKFKIAPVKQKFKLTIGKYRGTAGDAMTYHEGRPWTTIDLDNDIALGNCALTHRGAWWYKNCHLANLNGKWGDSRHSTGVNWEPWKGHLTSLDFTEMKIRPVGAVSSKKRRSLMTREKRTSSNVHKK
ncbi:tenascin-N [Nematolebias whitei]|uniref:tenascin-N n=1 Tax=Nematolebias whitei TaxID=451745 RepID=UPI00189B7406|nr:tenascin-N [Nematolebias whitei]